MVQQSMNTSLQDKWIYPWGTNYSSTKMYKELIAGELSPPIFKQIWKCATMLRYKIFFWLLLHDRVNSRNLLHRKSFYLPSYECVLCHTHTMETSMHLLWDCDFALNSWSSILGQRYRGISVFDEVSLSIQALSTPIAMEVIIMGCWNIWMQRNGVILKAILASVLSWRASSRADLLLLKHRIKDKFADSLSSWIDQCLA